MIIVATASSKNVASLLLSNSFTKFEGMMTTGLSISSLKIRFSFLKLGLGVCSPEVILAPFHTNSSSNLKTSLGRHRSMFGSITTCDDAYQLFDEMTQRQPLPSVVKFNQLLQAVTKMKHYSCSIDLFKQMSVCCVPVDVYTTNIVIKCCCQLYRTSEGFAVLGNGLKRAVVPDVCTFNTLLNGLVLEDRVIEAERLFKKLIKEKLCEHDAVMYSVVTYNTMLQGLFKVGRCPDAYKLYNEMRANGHNPDECTYRIILKGLCNNRQVEKALNLFLTMGDSKLNSDIDVYNILIDGGSKCGKLDVARGFFTYLTVKGLQPNVCTYNVMISGFCREGLVMEAKNLFLKMEESGCSPDEITYNIIIQGYLKNKHYNEVEFLLMEMDRKNFPLYASALSLLIDGIANRSLDKTLLKLIKKLVPKECINDPCFSK